MSDPTPVDGTRAASAGPGVDAGVGLGLNLDLDRARRLGFPEVVYAAGKTVAQTLAAATRLAEAHGQVLVTRANDETLAALTAALPAGRAHPRSGCFEVGRKDPTHGPIAVVSAGTSDERVAEEAALTARMRRVAVERFADCGVTGLHRILAIVDRLAACRAVIVCAGMEGALPAVVAGLVPVPIIAVPTSVGYGVSAGGHAALTSMLACCAPGVLVVNIDNGFGAGYAAAAIARQAPPLSHSP